VRIKFFESLNPVCQTAAKELVRFMVVRVEYDRNPTGYAYEGQVISRLMQSPRGGAVFLQGAGPSEPRWCRRWTQVVDIVAIDDQHENLYVTFIPGTTPANLNCCHM